MAKPDLIVVGNSEPSSDNSEKCHKSEPHKPNYSKAYGYESLDRIMLSGGEVLLDHYIDKIKSTLITGGELSKECKEIMMSEVEWQIEREPDNDELREAFNKGEEAVTAYIRKRLTASGKPHKRTIREKG